MSRRYFQPLLPLRFVVREGNRVLQQAWGEHAFNVSAYRWEPTGKYEWRDVPLMPEDQGDPHYWSQPVESDGAPPR